MVRILASYDGVQSRQFRQRTNWAKTLIGSLKELQRFRTFNIIVFSVIFFQFDNGDVHQQKANSDNRIHNKVGLFYLTCRVQEHVFLPK